MSTVDEVKQRLDIVEVISQYTTLAKAGRTMRGLCPFHSEKTPSFFVYPEQQSWHCFGACSTGGDVFSFVMKKESIDFGEALKLLAQRAGVTIPNRFEPDIAKDAKEKLYQLNEAAAQYFHQQLLNTPAGAKAKDYLAGRGITLKTMMDFQLGFSPATWESLKQYLTEKGYKEAELLEAGLITAGDDKNTHDRFRNRLMFPIRDVKGRAIGFGARVLDNSLPKYLNSAQTPVFDKSSTIYGLNAAAPAIKKQDMAIIVEGYMDVITAHQYGFTNVVASMGTAITDRQLTALKTKNVALALDSDSAGEEAMLRCVGYENTLNTELKVILLPEGKDPDDVIKAGNGDWEKLSTRAIPVVEYTFDMVTAKLDLTTTKDKTFALEQLMPIVAEIKDTIRQDHYLTRLAKITGLGYNKLEVICANTKPKRQIQTAKSNPLPSVLRPILSNPDEEYCLALLLRFPELRKTDEGLLSEHFENSENREIFLAWQRIGEISRLKDMLDDSLWEHLDEIVNNKKVLGGQIEQKYSKCVDKLKEANAKNLATRKAELPDLPINDPEVEKARVQLGEVFNRKAQKRI